MIRLARQILNGVAFLHRNNVVHLDLKVNAQEMLMTNIGRCVLSRVRMGKILFLLCNHSSFSVPRLCSREESLYKSIWPNYHVFFDVSWGNKAAVTEIFFLDASGFWLHITQCVLDKIIRWDALNCFRRAFKCLRSCVKLFSKEKSFIIEAFLWFLRLCWLKSDIGISLSCMYPIVPAKSGVRPAWPGFRLYVHYSICID